MRIRKARSEVIGVNLGLINSIKCCLSATFIRWFVSGGLVMVLMIGSPAGADAQHTISGRVINKNSGALLPFASLAIPSAGLWAIVDDKGMFSFSQVPDGAVTVEAQHIGFVKGVFEFTITRDTTELTLPLSEQSLQLDEVTVTAKQNPNFATSYTIDRAALDHMQMLNVTDATSLLPGGKTLLDVHLATSTSQPFAVNSASVRAGTTGERGSPLFGVAVELDGVRLSNNADPTGGGTDARNIASTNVESIEIVTGLPSVQYSDMTNGMVRIKTRRGKTPFVIDMLSAPNTKQIGVGKGVALGKTAGVMNVDLEHTESISHLASPYTTYKRNNLTLKYSNTFNKRHTPIELDLMTAGNLGGYNSASDPDLFVDTYFKTNDGALRLNATLNWLLNKRWITNIDVSNGLSYNNRTSEQSANRSSPSSVAAIHAMQEGYFVGQTYEENPNAEVNLIKPGYWYEVKYDDDRQVNYMSNLNARWNRKFGATNSKLLAGAELSYSVNNGRGTYYKDYSLAPTWREYRYDALPSTNNYAIYLEDVLSFPISRSEVQVMAGLRHDISAVGGSEYGTVNSTSPRAQVKYIFWENAKKAVRDLSIQAAWGKSIKLPSFTMLYPALNYQLFLTFAPGTTADGSTYYAYYNLPSAQLFNPDIRWQSNLHKEIRVDANIKGFEVSIVASQDQSQDTYSSVKTYTPFTYKFTGQEHLESSAIPINNRAYHVDQSTGVVTVSDKTGTLPSETLGYREFSKIITNDKPINGAPVTRRNLRWIIQSRPVRVIKTSFRVDGNYYTYKGMDQILRPGMPPATTTMADGNPYKYIGYFVGGRSSWNGEMSRSLDMNVTSITHISALRLIISVRLESSLYKYSRQLTEYSDGSERGFVLNSRNEYVAIEGSVYDGDHFVGLYPEYYVSLDDMNTPIPFKEKFLWARENDVPLYNELAKLVNVSNTNYFFNPSTTSVYFSANLNITKEIGRVASITFQAKNFVNNMATTTNSANNASYSLFGDNSFIPRFYYSLSLRIKV